MDGNRQDRAKGTAAETLASLVARATGEHVAPDDVVDRGGSPSPSEHVGERLGTADSVVGVVPRIDPSLVERLNRERTGESDDGDDGEHRNLAARIVLTGRARETVTGPAGAVVRGGLSSDVRLYEHDGDSPVGLLLADDRAVVGAFDDAGLAAVLIAEEPAVRNWVAETFQRYLSAAEPLFE